MDFNGSVYVSFIGLCFITFFISFILPFKLLLGLEFDEEDVCSISIGSNVCLGIAPVSFAVFCFTQGKFASSL